MVRKVLRNVSNNLQKDEALGAAILPQQQSVVDRGDPVAPEKICSAVLSWGICHETMAASPKKSGEDGNRGTDDNPLDF